MEVKTELEAMLDVFSQTKYTTSDKTVLEYTGDDSNPKVARMTRRLYEAIQDDIVRETMIAEDEIDDEFETLNRELAQARQKQEEALIAREDALKAREEERKAREEERKAREEERREEREARIRAEMRAEALEKQLIALLEKLNNQN